jgi:flagellar biosynthesis/type III secretory pathway protein FliH
VVEHLHRENQVLSSNSSTARKKGKEEGQKEGKKEGREGGKEESRICNQDRHTMESVLRLNSGSTGDHFFFSHNLQ